MAALWSAATVKLIGAGLDDSRHADDISRIIGDHDVATASASRDAHGHTSWNTSIQRRRILEPGELRALPRGQALLLATGATPALVHLQPWYTGPGASHISRDLARAIDTITAPPATNSPHPPPPRTRRRDRAPHHPRRRQRKGRLTQMDVTASDWQRWWHHVVRLHSTAIAVCATESTGC